MTDRFLLMGQNADLIDCLNRLSKRAAWTFDQVTTPTGLVVELEHEQPAGIWWDLSASTLDTAIATVTLVRSQVHGPIVVFVPRLTERIQRKLYQARVDDVIAVPFEDRVLRALIEQRLWLYQHIKTHEPEAPANPVSSEIVVIGHWQVDYQNYQVLKDGIQVELTPKEFQLLSYLIDHRNQVLSRDQLVNGVWGYDILNTSRIVDIHISHLRDKLEDDPHHPAHLLTVRGFGYKLVE
ncbi:MAG: response regulator transcription factor [Lactobacillaceae bacterium]|nr:response regulator transcription factor [Lactobacillaceae bacterium]